MIRIKKKQGKIIKAYRLGDNNEVLVQLINDKKIVICDDGTFEVFSQEAINSGSGHGQIASAGDWVRLDNEGHPYPCIDEWFQENMRFIGGDEYEQIPKELIAWTPDMEMSPEVEFLISKKGLKLDENDYDKFYQAILWGNPEAANRDAVLVFYSISYGENGDIVDADYNFVVRDEFERSYDIVS